MWPLLSSHQVIDTITQDLKIDASDFVPRVKLDELNELNVDSHG
jgi:hypothetical protein